MLCYSIFIHYYVAVNFRGHQVTSLQVLCLRDRMRGGKREIGHSIMLSINLPVFSKTGKTHACEYVSYVRDFFDVLCV